MIAASVTLNGLPAGLTQKTYTVQGTSRRITAAVVFGAALVALAAEYHALVRPIDVGKVDEGGCAKRDGRLTPGKKSNHWNGTAIDLNWSEEGAQNSSWGKKFFAQAKNVAAIAKLKLKYGAIISWGGDWRALDFMHWEIKAGVTEAKVRKFLTKHGIDLDGHVKAGLWDGVTPTLAQLLAVQNSVAPSDAAWRLACRLADLGLFTGTPKRGQQTYPTRAVQAWQRSIGAKPTGLWGPVAQRRIFNAP